ncbi:helix-turn-helix domain-containing protein [Macromonas nakdongensis]|uniref:helix-turn-helix domain-containing protein n=1 Tax=Macromonas nakdongensis TaxID=1843082 RepID=UPI000C339D75|nr:helix-turn-helix transcriptional regulator [Macromonas nakdongensis]
MRPSRNQLLITALGVEVKVRRLELALSQEDVAGRCELDRPFITMIESGRKQPTISVLHRLAVALDLSLGEFCQRVENRYRAESAAAAASLSTGQSGK